VIFPHQLAKLEEARLALALSEIADAHIEVGGGVACYGGSPESWMNLVAGVGLEAPVTDEELDRIVAFYDERGIDPRVEVCPFADSSLPRGLSRRGFGLSAFETVLCRDLAGAAPPILDPTVRFDTVDVGGQSDVDAFVAVHVACFAPEPGPKQDAMAEGARRMLRHPRTTAWVIRVDGEVAGGGALEVLDSLATLIATGVLEPFRSRGLQGALIAHRCALAREAGCTVATIGSDPTSPTGRNALRAGFVTAYTKAIMARGSLE
jgi:GNAT superfamily N-acetyltransferase